MFPHEATIEQTQRPTSKFELMKSFLNSQIRLMASSTGYILQWTEVAKKISILLMLMTKPAKFLWMTVLFF